MESVFKKLSYVLGLAAIGAFLGLVVFAANLEIKDFDLWLHLKMGEFIVHHQYVPDVDVLSCSIAGKPWVNHEWLFQVIAYLFFNSWGAEGLISMQVVVVVLTFLILLFLGYSKERQSGIVFLLLLSMLIYQMRFTIRPDIFSLLFFALYIYVLALHIDKRWSVYLLFFVQLLWTNFHGFFFFGPFIVLVGLGAEMLKRYVKLPWEWNTTGRLTNDEYKRLQWIFGLVILASFVNPLTFKGAWYPIGVLSNLGGDSKIFFKYIQELKPPITFENVFSLGHYGYYKLLIILSLFSFIFNRRKIDIGDFIIWLIFLLVSLVAVRNLVFFSFVAYLVCMTNFSSISLSSVIPLRFTHPKFQHLTSSLAKIVLILWMVSYGLSLSARTYFDFEKYELKSEFGGITQRNYPDKAADFLIANKIKGNFFNDFNSGAYLIGRCFPNIKVFIDGRTEVYGAAFFKDYQKMWKEGDEALLKQAVGRYNLTGALLNSTHEPINEKTLSFFYKNPDWALVYFDYDAVIFLKNTSENKSVINKFRIDLNRWKTKEMDLLRLGSRAVVPYQHLNRAFTLESLGFDKAAFKEIEETLKVSPAYIEPYKLMGKIYGKKDDNKKAFENFRIAAMFAQGDYETRINLGLAYEKLNDPGNAVKQYDLLTKRNPKNSKAFFMLARVLAKTKQYNRALEALMRGYHLSPKSFSELVEIADIILEGKDSDFPPEVKELLLLTKKDLVRVHNERGIKYHKEGRIKEAKEEFQKGLKIDPASQELKKNLKLLD
ncbi:MAG: hypothetical protein WC676_00195 [Candidatus Omnitrophota bacterium]